MITQGEKSAALKLAAQARGADCAACPYKAQPFVPCAGPPTAKLGFLGERPGRDEAEEMGPFKGQSGRIFHELLRGIGQPASGVFVDNAIACWPGLGEPDKEELKKAERCCRPRATADRAGVAKLVPMGTLALRSLGSLENITDVDSVPLVIPGVGEVFPVYHPANALPHRNPSMLRVLRQQFSRVHEWQQTSQFPLWELPPVITNLTHSEETCIEVLTDLTGPRPIGLDVETPMINEPLDWETKGRVLLNVGAARAEDKLAVCVDWLSSSQRLIDATIELVESPTPKVMQNGGFDARVFRWAEGVRVGNFAFDTMDAFRLLFPNLPAGLDAISAFLTRYPRWKDSFRAGRVEKGDYFAQADAVARAVYCGHDSFVQAWLGDAMMQKMGMKL